MSLSMGWGAGSSNCAGAVEECEGSDSRHYSFPGSWQRDVNYIQSLPRFVHS